MTDDEHSYGCEYSLNLEFECLEEEEIHLQDIFAGYYCIENLDIDRKLPQDVQFTWRHNGTPPTVFLRASERV